MIWMEKTSAECNYDWFGMDLRDHMDCFNFYPFVELTKEYSAMGEAEEGDQISFGLDEEELRKYIRTAFHFHNDRAWKYAPSEIREIMGADHFSEEEMPLPQMKQVLGYLTWLWGNCINHYINDEFCPSISGYTDA